MPIAEGREAWAWPHRWCHEGKRDRRDGVPILCGGVAVPHLVVLIPDQLAVLPDPPHVLVRITEPGELCTEEVGGLVMRCARGECLFECGLDAVHIYLQQAGCERPAGLAFGEHDGCGTDEYLGLDTDRQHRPCAPQGAPRRQRLR